LFFSLFYYLADNNLVLSTHFYRTPRSPWACPVCKKTRSKSKQPPKKKPRAEELLKKEEQYKNNKLSNNRVQTSKDLEPCRVMLNELENHESAWPFLVPVNVKQVCILLLLLHKTSIGPKFLLCSPFIAT